MEREPRFQSGTFRMRPVASPWGTAGPRPQSLVKIRPDRVGMRMKLPDGSYVVMPIGCLTADPDE
jgi:hypothetical protein